MIFFIKKNHPVSESGGGVRALRTKSVLTVDGNAGV